LTGGCDSQALLNVESGRSLAETVKGLLPQILVNGRYFHANVQAALVKGCPMPAPSR
jgi:hypothetical protein